MAETARNVETGLLSANDVGSSETERTGMAEVGVNPEQKRLESIVRSGKADPLQLAFISQQLGRWTSDHRREANLLTGWNHIAITPICKMAASATVSIKVADPNENTADDNDRGRPLPQSHPLYKLAVRPNPWLSGAIYRWEVIQQMHLHGGAIVWRVRGRDGKTAYRLPIPVSLCEPFGAGRYIEAPAGGIRVHPIESINTSMFAFEASYNMLRYASNRLIGIDDLILYRYPHPFDKSDGHSPTFAGGAWIELAKSIDDQRAETMAKGPRPKVLVSPPADANSTTEELDAWQRKLSARIKNSDDSVVAIAHGSATVAEFTPEEMAYVQAFEQIGPVILATHGTSKAAAGLQEAMTYGSLAASMDAFNALAVQPGLDIIGDEDTQTIAAEYDENITVRYVAPVIKNPEHEETKLANDVSSGTITVGEYRELRGRKRFGDERDNLIAGSTAAKEWSPLPKMPEAKAASLNPIEAMRSVAKSKAIVANKAVREERPYTVAVDLDGTLAERSADFDESTIGPPRESAVQVASALRSAGAKLIVFTCRDSDDVVRDWLSANGIPFDAINENPWAPESSGKIIADLYWDDLAVSAEGPLSTGLAEICERVTNSDVRERLKQQLIGPRFADDRGYLFIPVEGKAAQLVLDHGRRLRSEAVIELESQPHITLLPFIVGVEIDDVVRALSPVARFHVRFGDLNFFPADERRPTDCLYQSIESEDLADLRRLVESFFPHVQTYSQWTPHVTIAFLKDGEAQDSLGPSELKGNAMLVDKLVYRGPGGQVVTIPLKTGAPRIAGA